MVMSTRLFGPVLPMMASTGAVERAPVAASVVTTRSPVTTAPMGLVEPSDIRTGTSGVKLLGIPSSQVPVGQRSPLMATVAVALETSAAATVANAATVAAAARASARRGI